MASKSSLAVALSRLKQFDNPKILLEQYSTDSEIAAEILWAAYMQGDIQGKIVADLGCGPGIFGIGALMLGAKKVFFVDRDENAISMTKENLEYTGLKDSDCELMLSDVEGFDKKVDVVLMNPPFGTKIKHHDKVFLGKAFSIAKVVYSIHKVESKGFIEAFSKDSDFAVTHVLPFDMRLGRTMAHHKKKAVVVKVACWRLLKLS